MFLQVAKQEFCEYKTTVDAAVGSEEDAERAYLFTGDYVYDYSLLKGELLAVHNIQDKWMHLASNIDAGCTVRGMEPGGYIFIKQQDIFLYANAKSPYLVNTSNLNDYTLLFGLHMNEDDSVGCMTCYCLEITTCKMILVFKKTRHKVISCDFKADAKLENCELRKKLPVPRDLSDDVLEKMSECEALVFTSGIRTPSSVFFADETDFHFWSGNNKLYTVKIAEVFQCFASEMMTVVFAGVLCLTIMVLVVAAVFVVATKRKGQSVDDDEPTVTSGD